MMSLWIVTLVVLMASYQVKAISKEEMPVMNGEMAEGTCRQIIDNVRELICKDISDDSNIPVQDYIWSINDADLDNAKYPPLDFAVCCKRSCSLDELRSLC